MVNVVVIAGSAGSLDPLRRIVAGLPVPCSAAVFIVLHIGPHPSVLAQLLTGWGPHLATFAKHGEPIEGGHVYVAPPDRHLLLEAGHVRLDPGPKINYTRPSANPLFLSAAYTHRGRVLGIVLSGYGSDGASGLRAISQRGGIALVQAPDDAEVPSMPIAAIRADHPDACLPVGEIVQRVRTFCSGG